MATTYKYKTFGKWIWRSPIKANSWHKWQKVSSSSSSVGTSSTVTTIAKSTNKTVNESIQYYIPATTITFNAKFLKPNTKVYPFFDGKNVSAYVTPSGGSLGGVLTTDSYGEISGTFAIPNTTSLKFPTGSRIFKLSDDAANTSPTTYAQATYNCSGNNDNANGVVLTLESVDASSDPTIFDPTVQSFYVNEDGGVFVTKIDTYFYTKDSTYPIIVQLRTVESDTVSSTYIPNSTVVLKPSSINVDGTATTITFPNPIYLQDGYEYALCFITNSKKYSLYTCVYGDKNSSNVTATKDSRIGDIFKFVSENTWKRDSTYGIKFNLYKSVFDTATSHTMTLNNTALGTKTLDANPISITNSSNTVTIIDENHAFNIGSYVTLSGLDTATYGGITSTELNAVHKITAVTVNSYSFNTYMVGTVETAITAATATLSFGGSTIVVDQDLQYNNLVLNFEEIELPDTSISWTYKSASGQSIGGTESPYIPDTVESSTVTADNTEMAVVKKIASTYNETNTSLAGSKSLYLYVTMKSSNPNISPVIDKNNLNAIIVENTINSDITNETVNVHGNAVARYVTKSIALAESAIGLKVTFDAVVQSNASVYVYYKTLGSGESTTIDDKAWTLMSLEDAVAYSSDNTDYQSYSYLADSLTEYSTFEVKIVMCSTNSSQVPLIKSFAAIALGS